MLATEYILRLRELIDEHGDQELIDDAENPLEAPEYNEDGDPAFVVPT